MKFKDWWGKEHSLPKNKTVSWRPSAYGLIVRNKKVLLIKARAHGLWELPGGGVELNETILDALEREIYEETGYKISVRQKQPLCIRDNYFYAPDLDEYFRAIPMIFLAKLKGKNQKIRTKDRKEVREVKWFGLDALPKPMNPMAVAAIKIYKEDSSRVR